VLGRLGQRTREHAVEAGGQPALRGLRRRVLQVREHRGGDGVAHVRRLAGERRVQDAAQRVDVRARVDPARLQLLGRRVVDGAQPAPDLGQLRVGRLQACEAEVGQVHVLAATVEQHVGRLDVAVHETAAVRGVQRGGHLPDHRGGTGGVERAAVTQQAVQVGALHVTHDEVQPTVLLAGAVHRDHVGMVDRGGHPPLALEALAELRVGRAVGDDQLERDRPPEAQLRGPVHHAHPAAAGDALDAAAGEHVTRGQLGHGAQCDGRERTGGTRRGPPAPGQASRCSRQRWSFGCSHSSGCVRSIRRSASRSRSSSVATWLSNHGRR